jgi:hypothetical protein
MTDANTAGASARLYSQIPFDEHGNFHYHGDLYKPGEPLAETALRMGAHLTRQFPGTCFSIRREKGANRRKITAEILDTEVDLSTRDIRDAFITAVQDQMARFGFTNANVYQDYHSCSFFREARIGRPYWSTLAERRGDLSPIEQTVSLAAFKKLVRPGDRMKLISAPGWNRTAGIVRRVKAVRTKDLIFEGPSYLDFPRAAQFACDGTLVRIAIGTEHQPAAHLLYQWFRGEAGDDGVHR